VDNALALHCMRAVVASLLRFRKVAIARSARDILFIAEEQISFNA